MNLYEYLDNELLRFFKDFERVSKSLLIIRISDWWRKCIAIITTIKNVIHKVGKIEFKSSIILLQLFFSN